VLGYGVRCDATFCGSYVTAPGPFNKWSAVGWLKNLNLSAQCQGNGVDWQSGNTLRISDSVVQGYNQFGIRTGTSRVTLDSKSYQQLRQRILQRDC
jgi:hypothetical protein